jgi:hypothetical protein
MADDTVPQLETEGDEDAFYDAAILEYLAEWKVAASEEEHRAFAARRFGLDKDDAGFVDQALCSAALGTLKNWINSQDDPWWQAALRLSQSPHRELLVPLRKSIMGS